MPLDSAEAKRIKELLIQRAMVSGTEWSASGEGELASLLYDCRLGLSASTPEKQKRKTERSNDKGKNMGTSKAWNLLRQFGRK